MKKIAFMCLPGLEGFLPDIVKHLQGKHLVKTCFNVGDQEMAQAIQWADVVWLEWGNELAAALTNSPLLDNKFVVLRIHSYEVFAGFIPNIKWEKINHLIFVAEHIRDLAFQQIGQIPNLNIENFPVDIIPNGLDVDKYKFADRKPGKNLAFLSNINAKKGPMLLMHAFYVLCSRVARVDNHYHLYIGGAVQDPRFSLYMNYIAQEMGLLDHIHFDGFIQDVPKWLEDKDYIVCTSPLESQGMGIMEAMAMGIKPVVHNFVGAKNVYDEKYLWTTIDQFVYQIESEKYDSKEYRTFVEKNYLLRHRLKEISELVDEIEIKEVKAPQKVDSYNEFQYWNVRPHPTDPNMSDETTRQHIQYIRKHVDGIGKVLDLGPGIGRTFSAYENVAVVEGCDISTLYVEQAKKEAERYNFHYFHRHITMDGLDRLPYDDKEFDVAVASEVFLHQRPTNILKVMRELARVAGLVVAISWQSKETLFMEPGEETEGMNHCFHYDYEKLCGENGWEISDVQHRERQIYFVYKEK